MRADSRVNHEPGYRRLIARETLGDVLIAGVNGMVGKAIYKLLTTKSSNLVRSVKGISRQQADFLDWHETKSFFDKNKCDWLVIAAAKVGGIKAHQKYPKDFIFENLVIQNNLLEAANQAGVKKVIFLGSACIYPKYAKAPIREDSLLTGVLEPSNEGYALAKIIGLKLCHAYNSQLDADFRCLMPTNLYGVGDNYHPEDSHVLPGLLRRFHVAKLQGDDIVSVWGSGSAIREFLFVDDLADAIVHVMSLTRMSYRSLITDDAPFLNVGGCQHLTIKELATLISRIVGFKGTIEYDQSISDGTPVRIIDSSRLEASGWSPSTMLETGIREVYLDYLSNYAD